MVFSTKQAADASPWCRKCQRWGHTIKVCKSSPACGWCGENHHRDNHRQACVHCNGKNVPKDKRTPAGQPCPHAPYCVNCRERHTSDGTYIQVKTTGDDGQVETHRTRCPFWNNQFKTDYYKKLYERVGVHSNPPVQRRAKPPPFYVDRSKPGPI